MKIIWTLALAVIVTATLSGSAGEVLVEPVSVREVRATITPTPTAEPVAEPTVEPVAPVDIPVEVPAAPVAPVEPATPVVEIPPAPIVTAPVAPAPVAPIVEPVVEPIPVDPFAALAEWLLDPTFTCEEGTVPGWLNDAGVPTSCVDNHAEVDLGN